MKKVIILSSILILCVLSFFTYTLFYNNNSVKRKVVLHSYTFSSKSCWIVEKPIIVKVNNKIIYNDIIHSEREEKDTRVLDAFSGKTKEIVINNVIVKNEDSNIPIEIVFDCKSYKYQLKYKKIANSFCKKINIRLNLEEEKLFQMDKELLGFEVE